jgi:hypothetical protein
MLLPADAELAFQPVRRERDGGVRIASSECVVRQDGLGPFQGVLDRDAGPLGLDLHDGQPDRPAGDIAGRGDHGEDRLSEEADLAVREQRIVAEGRRHVVLAGDVGGGEDSDDAGHRTHRGDVEGDQASARFRRLADRHMERAVRLADVVDILRHPLHVLDGGIVRQGLPDMAERLRVDRLGRCVHPPTPPPAATPADRRSGWRGSGRRRFRSGP